MLGNGEAQEEETFHRQDLQDDLVKGTAKFSISPFSIKW